LQLIFVSSLLGWIVTPFICCFQSLFLSLSKRSANVQTLRGGCARIGRIPEDTRHWSLDAQAPTGASSPTSIAPGRRRIHESPERNAVIYFRLSEQAASSRDAAGPSRGKETARGGQTRRGGARRAITHKGRSLDKSVIFGNKTRNWFYDFN